MKKNCPLAIQQEQKQTGTHRSTNLEQKSTSDCSFEDCQLAGKAGSVCTSLLPSQTFGHWGYRERHFKEKMHRLQIEKHNVRMQSEFQMAGGGSELSRCDGEVWPAETPVIEFQFKALMLLA